MRAFNYVPARFDDGRHIAMEEGLRRAGYDVVRGSRGSDVEPSDVCITWNLYGSAAERARTCRDAHGRAIVAEEAYIRKVRGLKYFALALDGHNGSGRWNVGLGSRWDAWGLDVKPWRREGEHVLVCGQRGFGYNPMAMPDHWPDRILGQLRRRTTRPIWFRPHPKRRRKMPTSAYDKVCDWEEPLRSQLEGAWAVVIWSSSSSVAALLDGYPVFYSAPALVCGPACHKGVEAIETPDLGKDRLSAFRDMAWAQWSTDEIRSGEAFRCLLR